MESFVEAGNCLVKTSDVDVVVEHRDGQACPKAGSGNAGAGVNGYLGGHLHVDVFHYS